MYLSIPYMCLFKEHIWFTFFGGGTPVWNYAMFLTWHGYLKGHLNSENDDDSGYSNIFV